MVLWLRAWRVYRVLELKASWFNGVGPSQHPGARVQVLGAGYCAMAESFMARAMQPKPCNVDLGCINPVLLM